MVASVRPHRDLFKYLFFATIIFYAFFLSLFGFETWDTGYIPGYAWRIVNGETVYGDFFYKGPPVTLYLNAFFLKILPDAGQFYFIKAIYILMFGLQVFFIVSGIDRIYNLRSIFINKWVLMSVGFVISMLNFPGYPWPTTDGLLFASIAFYLTAISDRMTIGKLIAIALTCILSSLTKQSFYPVPILFTVWIFSSFGFRNCRNFVGILAVTVSFFTVILGDNFSNFLDQTIGETHFSDLIYVGFHLYKGSVATFSAIAIITFFTVLMIIFKRNRNNRLLTDFVRWFPVGIASYGMVVAFWDMLHFSHVIFLACIAAIIGDIIIKNEKLNFYIPILVALGIAWCASISLGYPYPIFFATAIISCFLVLRHFELVQIIGRVLYPILSLILIGIGFTYAWKPYREKPLPELTVSLTDISPKLAGLRTNESNHEKLADLKNLAEKYPQFITAPSIPMAYYLFDHQNPLPADWLINTEVNRKYDLFLTLASDPKNYIFLEKSFLENEANLPAETRSSIIAWRMFMELQQVDESRHFIVLNGKK